MRQGQAVILHPGEEIDYLELGNEETFAAQAFLSALEKYGIRISRRARPAHTLLAVSFSNYKAFKGHINLSPQERLLLSQQAAAHARSVFISFGSPFGTEGIDALTERLFLFSPAHGAQMAAADLLTGRLQAQGKMPL